MLLKANPQNLKQWQNNQTTTNFNKHTNPNSTSSQKSNFQQKKKSTPQISHQKTKASPSLTLSLSESRFSLVSPTINTHYHNFHQPLVSQLKTQLWINNPPQTQTQLYHIKIQTFNKKLPKKAQIPINSNQNHRYTQIDTTPYT